MYAWSQLRSTDEEGKVTIVKVGDEVDAGKLGLDDDEFNELVAVGAVREQEYPVPANYDGSPVEFVRDQLREAASEQFMQALPFGSVPPISERPPGSMPTVPIFDERAREAVELSKFDPDKPPEEGQEPEKSEQDKQLEEQEQSTSEEQQQAAQQAAESGATAPPSAVANPTPDTTTQPGTQQGTTS